MTIKILNVYCLNDRPYLNLDSFVNVQILCDLHESICRGIVFSEISWMEPGRRLAPQESRKPVTQDLMRIYREAPKQFSGMTTSQATLYTQLITKTYSGNKMISLRQPKDWDWHNKHYTSKCYDHNNYDFFPKLRDYIQTLPFDQIGRVCIFLLENDISTPIHRDICPEYLEERSIDSHNHEFIWLRPNEDKRFFIYDAKKGVKHYVRGHAIFFNELDFHGTDPEPFPTYSIRVDGQFTKEFREKLQLPLIPRYQ